MSQLLRATPDLKVSVLIFLNKLQIRLKPEDIFFFININIFQVGFNYNIELVEDNNYGAYNLTTKVWNGLVRVNINTAPTCCLIKHYRS